MSPPPGAAFQPPSERLHDLQHLIEHAAHLLPSQGPITVFVHHNTLHPFEDLTFDEATRRGMSTYGCQTYLSESAYRRLLAEGRILERDLETVLIEQLGDAGEELLGFMGPRHHLYMAMLQRPLLVGSDAELRWLMAETDALIRFREETPVSLKRQSIGDTRAWAVREVQNGIDGADHPIRETILQLSQTFGRSQPGSWNDKTAEAFTLHLLWHVCLNNTYDFGEPQPVPLRHRDLLLRVIGADSDRLVNEILIPFCAAFLDQGYAHWSLPDRDRGFFQAFLALYRDGRPAQRWMRRLPLEIASIIADGQTPLECIAESLQFLGVARSEQGEYVSQTLLALRGWAGMLWQMETNAEWTVHPAPPGTLIEYLAVRLLLERLVLHEIAEDDARFSGSLADLRDQLQERIVAKPAVSIEQRAYSIFQLAQVRGWSPHDLYQLTSDEWLRLTHEVERFSSFERRRIYHLAYERRYRTQALHAIHVHASQAPAGHSRRPTFQIITCIDDREESFRRHLEEIDPRCETFGAAGFFGVAIYYRGAADAHFRPLCPVIMKPQHYVRESVAYSLTSSSLQREDTRRTLGAAYHHWHAQSRTFAGGIVTALLGSLASIPMVTRILFPRMTAQMRRIFGSLVQVPPVTELLLERTSDPPSPEAKHLGFSVTEMANCVERVLRDIGLIDCFAKLVFFIGHGSGSLNNPHESAYNCGACSGGRGGPNARAYSQMANHPQVRQLLRERGLEIPESTVFVGGFHNTCDEDVVFYDLDRIPVSHRHEFEANREVIDAARARNAHERCRRFESAALDLTPQQALEHVQTRAEDLSQVRPEYNHATNALCIVGRRQRTRGLFLDRRAFLSDYDPTQDDAQHTILTRILGAAVPVCGGISLEYYFSCVDVAGFGCGSKLPHNIVSMLGVMEGAASDLRPGLSQQMIEIHEPIRILFVVETTPAAMNAIMDRNPNIGRLVRNEWVQLALLNPDSSNITLFTNGEFVPYQPESDALGVVTSSADWYKGRRDHLGFARVCPAGGIGLAEDSR